MNIDVEYGIHHATDNVRGHNTNYVDRCDTTPLIMLKYSVHGLSLILKDVGLIWNLSLSSQVSFHYKLRACEEHLRVDLAENIINAQTPLYETIIVSAIKDSDPYCERNLKKLYVMRDVLNAKIELSKEFRKEVLYSGDKLLVEAFPTDKYWGSGSSYNLILTTLPQ